MLTQGWNANTVTPVLGVRAFGTQLLCEQVIGGRIEDHVAVQAPGAHPYAHPGRAAPLPHRR